jgi:Tol biopolymer transport system component
LAAACLVIGALVFAVIRPPLPVSSVSPLVRFDIVPPGQVNDLRIQDRYLALSPDGKQLAFVATIANTRQLFVRPLEAATAQMLAGTEDAGWPFWSPDSRSIAFFASGKLKRIDLAGGTARVLCDASSSGGGAWNSDGIIVFGTSPYSALMRVSAGGGPCTAATQLDSGQTRHVSPQFLPDGRHFIYTAASDRPDGRGIFVASVDGERPRRIREEADSPALFAPPDSLLFIHQGSLVRVHFDPARGTMSGDPVPLLPIAAFGPSGPPGFSASNTGVLAYLSPTDRDRRSRTVWVDRRGNVSGPLEERQTAVLEDIQLSPVGPETMGVRRELGRDGNVWLIDAAKNIEQRFTFGQRAIGPIWSPDGQRIVFGSPRNGHVQLFEQAVRGTSTSQLLLETAEDKVPADWSPDDTTLLYQVRDQKTGMDVWALPLGGKGEPYALLHSAANEAAAQFSPNGRWLAYQSDESGTAEIYVRGFPLGDRRWQVSLQGGNRPRWRRDGKELFYLSSDARLMAVPIAVNGDGQTLEPGAPLSLFATRPDYTTYNGLPASNYAVAPDGQRFLMNILPQDLSPSPITLVVNWPGLLKK